MEEKVKELESRVKTLESIMLVISIALIVNVILGSL